MQREKRSFLEPELEERIEAFARATKQTPSDVLRQALDEYETKHVRSREGADAEESVYAALKRAGLIGCVKGGPSDLSTNPKYMEGFGGD